MISLTRFALGLSGAFGGVVLQAIAQTSPSAAISELPPELNALLAALPKWSMSAAVKVGYGYKDNLLLSFAGEEESAFARSGVNLILVRVPQGSFEYSLFAEAETTRYFTAKTSDRDAKLWVRTEPAYRIGETLKLSLPVTGFYYDQVFDVSDTDVERRVAAIKVHGGMVGPSVHWDVFPTWWLEAQAVGQRKRYDDGSNDSRIGEGTLRLGWTPFDRVETQLSAAKRWRNYDRRAQYSAAGRELIGTELKIAERELEGQVELTLDSNARWKTTTSASLLHCRDNGPGYFDYREARAAQELEWRNRPWMVRIRGSASRLDFSVQKVGLGIDPPARLKDEFKADLLVERQLSPRWTVMGSYMWERSRSNDAFASYRVNEGLLGLRWSWEK